MSVCIYDKALTEKFKRWTEGTDLTVTSPDETRRLFETILDKNNDSPIQLPLICLRRGLGYTVDIRGKKSSTYLGFRRDISTSGATFVNMIPVILNYQVDVYARHYEEAEDYMRNIIFNIVNYPRFEVEVPYKNIDFQHAVNIIPGQQVVDNSSINERLIVGQFTRLSYQFDIDEAFLWDVRERGSLRLVEGDLHIITPQNNEDIVEELDFADDQKLFGEDN